MSNKQAPTTAPTPDKGTGHVASALKVMENTETVKDSLRHKVDAGLLGTCIVFLAAMLAIPQKPFDTSLTIALVH